MTRSIITITRSPLAAVVLPGLVTADGYAEIALSNLTPGDDWRLPIPVEGLLPSLLDTARMHVRVTAESDTVVIELSTANGRILLESGFVTLIVEKAATGAIRPGAYVWDLELTIADNAQTIMGGTLTVRRDITRGPSAPSGSSGLDFSQPSNSQYLTIT